ncbi:acyl-CoA dehydrogenase/oxidase [Zychaea mexicana]|uniref:acyl-CoA dehydrogenase/oxidase n=1 Tax=Zychaea mexicana TaxID=64656 RepID=UPI0022FF1E1E|nr:acyl-CoA dehydrogenase/oxidase [Zychaea mexicana]KAI9488694.1 acyl-CoA dehydrogenase/oxidase [Zychaea mexicana]
MVELKTYTREEVSRHAAEEDIWIIIDTDVYNMSVFIDMHPGGAFPILEYAGKDATEAFYGLHRQEVLLKYKRYKIGTLADETPQIKIRQHGDNSTVPYAEMSAFMGYKSPYYNDSHFRYQAALRKICDELKAEAQECDSAGDRPSDEFVKKLAAHHLLAAHVGPGPWLHGLMLPGNVPGTEFDYFHDMITHQEFARWGAPGLVAGITGGMTISLPTVLNYGKPELKAELVPLLLSGEKRMSLAITEPYTGSDVASIRTVAKKVEGGYVVNGVKKWITTGRFAHYFATAVRTEKGISMLLIERQEGVETKPIKTSYSQSAGTAYVTFENVFVPDANLLGIEHQGFRVVLSNFNHERFMLIAQPVAVSRNAVEECFKWAMQRKVFGKPLIDQPVIRNKLAKMIAGVESCQTWTENIAYQMNHMKYAEQADKLAGPIALLKFHATRMMHDVSDEACQIFGGRALTKTGMGKYIEDLQRTYKFNAILGGSEEIMADLGVRQAMKKFPADARL